MIYSIVVQCQSEVLIITMIGVKKYFANKLKTFYNNKLVILILSEWPKIFTFNVSDIVFWLKRIVLVIRILWLVKWSVVKKILKIKIDLNRFLKHPKKSQFLFGTTNKKWYSNFIWIWDDIIVNWWIKSKL
jgi:hypothetical protein